jgi:hypothetical protein
LLLDTEKLFLVDLARQVLAIGMCVVFARNAGGTYNGSTFWCGGSLVNDTDDTRLDLGYGMPLVERVLFALRGIYTCINWLDIVLQGMEFVSCVDVLDVLDVVDDLL